MSCSTPRPAALFHIARAGDWERAREAGSYRVASLDTEGFIHLSTAAQAAATATRLFPGAADLVLLRVDAGRLRAELRWERATDVDEEFPHLYGPLELDAVAAASPWRPDDQGRFHLPPAAAPR